MWTLHDLTWWKYPETASRLGVSYYKPMAESLLKRRGALIITPSLQVRDEVISFFDYDPELVYATQLGGAPNWATEAKSSGRSRPFVLTVASQEPRKNLPRLLRAYEQSDLASTAELVVVGRRAWGALDKVPRGVSILDGVSDSHLSALYRESEAVVVPSLYEGFGLPVLEALQQGARLACSSIPVFHEVAGDFAVYFDPKEVSSIADGLSAVLASPKPSKERLLTWTSQFSWDRCAERTLSVYDIARQRQGEVA